MDVDTELTGIVDEDEATADDNAFWPALWAARTLRTAQEVRAAIGRRGVKCHLVFGFREYNWVMPISRSWARWLLFGLPGYAEVFKGTGTNADRVYLVEWLRDMADSIQVYSQEKDAQYCLEPLYLKPALRGRSIRRYGLADHRLRLIVPYEPTGDRYTLVPEARLAELAPLMLNYLRANKPRLDERENGRFVGDNWYCFGRPQNMHRFEVQEKIVLPDIAIRGTCYLDTEQHWLLDTAYAIVLKPEVMLDLRYLLAILNSPLLTYFLRETGTPLRGGYFRMKTAYLTPFPVRAIDFTNPTDLAHHDQLVALTDQMLTLHRRLAAEQNPQVTTILQRRIEATDRQIDTLVYALYGLTENEIAIVEQAGNTVQP